MAETINGLIAEAKRNKYSLIPSLTENGNYCKIFFRGKS